MSGTISLESALRTCKVDTAWANKVQSDRFLNPDNMVCPIWSGLDITGRAVCTDSFYTKSGGCNSAMDRVIVENNVSRPQYMEYITLSASGIQGNIYGNMPSMEESMRRGELDKIQGITGNFGTQMSANVYPSCGAYPYNQAMSQVSQQSRQASSVRQNWNSQERRGMSGF